ncbi:MAG: metalloregulator ArsR/SmtB family transcription factor [Bacteroidota bacterium]
MTIVARRDVFQAIADPTRREIIHLLSKKSMNVNALGEHFTVSRPAISQHLKILVECGLVEMNQQGRERICAAKLASLNEVQSWVTQYSGFCEKQLDSLDAYLKTVQQKKHTKK